MKRNEMSQRKSNQNPKTRHLIRKLGGPALVAEALGVTHSAVCQWKKIPGEHCPFLEAWSASKGKPVSCEELRPDLYKRLNSTTR